MVFEWCVTRRGGWRHRRGVEVTIEESYRKWSDDLVRYATALVGPADAPDLVADVFATMLDRGDDAWHEVRDPRGYAFRAVTNAARMLGRSRTRRRTRETRWSAATSEAELITDPAVIDALSSLSIRQRAVVFLTYWEDLDAATVGRRLGISDGSVKRYLARARATLKEVLT